MGLITTNAQLFLVCIIIAYATISAVKVKVNSKPALHVTKLIKSLTSVSIASAIGFNIPNIPRTPYNTNILYVKADENDTVESDSDQEDLNSLKRVSTGDGTTTMVPVDKNILSNTNLEKSREIVLTLKAYIDEAERDLFAKKWDNVIVYLDTISEQEESFVDLIKNLYPGNNPIENSARDAIQFEGKSIFSALEALREACIEHQINLSEKYYAKLLLSYDRFLKAGDLYPTYDIITSTEIFFKDTPLTTLRFDETSKVEKLDQVVLKLGPDMGKIGKVIYIDGDNAIVKLDSNGQDYQEVKRVPMKILAKTTNS